MASIKTCKNKRVLFTIVLAIITTLGCIYLSVNLYLRNINGGNYSISTFIAQRQFNSLLIGGTSCQNDADCFGSTTCVIGGNVAVNRETAEKIIKDTSLLESVYKYKNCAVKSRHSLQYPVACINNKCQIKQAQCQSDQDCNGLNCSMIGGSTFPRSEYDLMLFIKEESGFKSESFCAENANRRNESVRFCSCSWVIK